MTTKDKANETIIVLIEVERDNRGPTILCLTLFRLEFGLTANMRLPARVFVAFSSISVETQAMYLTQSVLTRFYETPATVLILSDLILQPLRDVEVR
jgi:hypothetical protein